MHALRVLAVLLSVIALAFAAVGCGGDGDGGGDSASGTEAPEWAATVCGAVGDWVQSLQDNSQKLGSELRDSTNLKNVKATFVDFLEDAEQSSEAMVAKVEGAGAPDVDNGEEIQQKLVSGLEEIQQSFSTAVDKANDLSTTNPQSFAQEVGALTQEVQRNLEATGNDFNNLDTESSELKEATDNEPACAKLSNAS